MLKDCLTCENCDFQITDADENIIKDYIFQNLTVDDDHIRRFKIQLLEDLGNRDIVDFLLDDKSNYRITEDARKKDFTFFKKLIKKT